MWQTSLLPFGRTITGFSCITDGAAHTILPELFNKRLIISSCNSTFQLYETRVRYLKKFEVDESSNF